jgi:DNA-binding transcriptional ArsR family regulator
VSDDEYEAAGELLRVLSAPIRLALITRLAEGPATVSALTEAVGHSQPLVSQHLRILRSVRLVHAVTDGRERIYELVDDHVAHIVADAVRHTAEPGHRSDGAHNVNQDTTQDGNRRSTTTQGRASARPRAKGTP